MWSINKVGIQCPFCNTAFITRLDSWIYGLTKSCGCLRQQKATQLKLKHGHNRVGKRTPEYESWASMMTRCTNPKAINYKHYGGRGIKICQAWYWFPYFLEDMGKRPLGKTLDRINPNGDYEPENCRWATWHEQRLNQRNKL